MFRAIAFIRDRLKLRGWIALCLILATAVGLPRALSSRFVSQRRVALSLKRAQAHLVAHELDQARSELRAALRLQPGNADARYQLANIELGLGNWELAFLEFQSLTELHPDSPDGWIGLADLMVKSGLLEAPEAALDKAIAAAPKRADAHSLRGEIRFRLGRYHGAHLDARAAVEAAPKDVACWALLVRSAARSQGADAGIEAVNRGIAAVGQDPALLLPLASLLAERGSARDASKQLDALLLQRPVDEEALALRAVLDAGGGRAEASLARLDAALELLPKSRTLRDAHARLQSARNDPAAIAALLGELIRRDLGPAPVPPSRVRAEAQSGRDKLGALAREHWPGRLAQMRQALEVHMRQQSWTAAQRIVESARRTYPDTTFAAFLAGILELARGDADEAEKYLSEALKSAPRSPVVATALAKTWSRKKGAAFAGERLMRLAERDPGFAFARAMAARAYMDARDPIQAEAALRRGLVLQPDSPLPYQHLADHYLDVDRATDALSILQQGLDRFPQALDLQMTLAQISADLGKANEAIRIYDDVLSRRPDLDVVEYKLATLVASQVEDGASSQRLLQVAQRLQSDLPSDPLLLDGLGWVRYRAGDAIRARALLQAAVNGAPDEPGPHFHLAAIYARERKADLARSELKAALDSKRPFPERLEAMRLLRGSSSAASPNGTASATSPGQ